MHEHSLKHHITKLAVVYSSLVILLICIPSYFYMQSEIKNYRFQHINLLQEHALTIQRSIYDFNDSKSHIFQFPKSFQFKAALYDKEENLIYETSSLYNKENEPLFKRYALSKNRLGAKWLVVSKHLDYKEIYLKIAVLTLSIGLFIFISALIILRQSITPYKRANEYLDAFFNDAMHELKTPLGVIQLNLELLENKIEQSKEVTRSLNGVKSLLLIYEDIEYLIKNKRVTYTKESIDFSLFLNQRLELFESLAISKQIRLQSNIQPNIHIQMNRTELQRIIDNTLSNAIKYSKAKQTVHINLKKEEKTVLNISDQGKGIEHPTRIFNRYYREENIKGGFGIGLNIVKNICDKHNIIIEVVSKPNEGSTFTYYFDS